MPNYAFQCHDCMHDFEKIMPLGTTETPPCPACGGTSRKIMKPPMVHFKGSGFYKTDSNKSSTPIAKPAKPADTKPAETKPVDPKPASASKSEPAPSKKSA
ncbi:MAG: zinc ribbon domain-containing protein [Candidatus Peribacteraceae bacterium]|nr:zinc ribbon domain-containing protein [Candidatus Peribacteraceae bacterium]